MAEPAPPMAPSAPPPLATGPALSPHEAAVQTLVAINAQVDQARAELAALNRELAHVRRALTHSRGAQLVEANEHLVLAALDAQESADTARGDLDTLTHASQSDSLTGLPNRALMLDRLENAIALARRRGTHLAVLFVDLDGFKNINDSQGHAVGDAVLRAVAVCLSAAVRHSDTVSRYGGDEFLLLLTEVATASDAGLVATKALAGLREITRLGDATVRLTASVGIALYPHDGLGATILIDRADAAMYQAKQGGGGRVEFHSAA